MTFSWPSSRRRETSRATRQAAFIIPCLEKTDPAKPHIQALGSAFRQNATWGLKLRSERGRVWIRVHGECWDGSTRLEVYDRVCAAQPLFGRVRL